MDGKRKKNYNYRLNYHFHKFGGANGRYSYFQGQFAEKKSTPYSKQIKFNNSALSPATHGWPTQTK